jgi:hypothetical protein
MHPPFPICELSHSEGFRGACFLFMAGLDGTNTKSSASHWASCGARLAASMSGAAGPDKGFYQREKRTTYQAHRLCYLPILYTLTTPFF